MIVTQKHLPRRTVLRGLGTTLALPQDATDVAPDSRPTSGNRP